MNRQSKARGAAWWRGVQLTESACKLSAVAACCRHSASEAAMRSRGDGPEGTARHFTEERHEENRMVCDRDARRRQRRDLGGRCAVAGEDGNAEARSGGEGGR